MGGGVMEVWLPCYLNLLSTDRKIKQQDSHIELQQRLMKCAKHEQCYTAPWYPTWSNAIFYETSWKLRNLEIYWPLCLFIGNVVYLVNVVWLARFFNVVRLPIVCQRSGIAGLLPATEGWNRLQLHWRLALWLSARISAILWLLTGEGADSLASGRCGMDFDYIDLVFVSIISISFHMNEEMKRELAWCQFCCHWCLVTMMPTLLSLVAIKAVILTFSIASGDKLSLWQFLVSWPSTGKLPCGKWHKTSVMLSQHWLT